MNQHKTETSFSCNHMMYFVHVLQRQRVQHVVATCYVFYSNFTDSDRHHSSVKQCNVPGRKC